MPMSVVMYDMAEGLDFIDSLENNIRWFLIRLKNRSSETSFPILIEMMGE